MAAAESVRHKEETVADLFHKNPEASRGPLKIVGGTSDVGDEALRQRFANFMAKYPHLTTAELSRDNQIGFSKTGLDGYLKGTYFLFGGPNGSPVNPAKSKLERLIREYLDRVEGDQRSGEKSEFVQTVCWQQFQYLCNTAIEENIIGVGYGSPGVGKTVSMGQYSLEKLTTRPIHILCSFNINARYFIQKIAEELNVKTNVSIPELEDRVADRLIKNKRSIFIDQGNYLPLKSVGTVLHLWDRARVPIIMTGTYKLYQMFMQLSDTEDVKGQVSSRIALMIPLMGLDDSSTKTIVMNALGQHATPEVIAEIFNTISRRVVDPNGDLTLTASHRNLSFLLDNLRRFIKKRSAEIDAKQLSVKDLVAPAASRLILD